MRPYFIHMANARPFEPFTILMQGGHVFDVISPEFVTIENAGLHAMVYEPAGRRSFIDVEKVVGFRTIHPVNE